MNIKKERIITNESEKKTPVVSRANEINSIVSRSVIHPPFDLLYYLYGIQ